MDPDDTYRNHLVKTRQASQSNYDKAVLLLSAGALGVSMTFVKDIVGDPKKAYWMPLLMVAWICWGISCASVLYSHFASVSAHDESIAALDDEREPDIASNKMTGFLNVTSGVFFLVGLVLFCVFAYCNIGHK
jgi:hypothetical protein